MGVHTIKKFSIGVVIAPFVSISEAEFQFHFFNKKEHQLYADYPLITKSVNHYLFTDDGLLITNMILDKKIEVYDHIKQEKLYSIEIDKATRKIAFGHNDYGFLEEDFEAHNEHLIKSGVKSRYEISDMLYVEDTIFVFLKRVF